MTRIASVLLALTIAANASAGVKPVKPANPPHPVVNVNTATEAQYMLLPGVGPKLAAALNDAAETGNAACDHKCQFKSVDDLLRVKGIGPAKLAAMRPFVVLTGATTAVAKIKVAKVAKP